MSLTVLELGKITNRASGRALLITFNLQMVTYVKTQNVTYSNNFQVSPCQLVKGEEGNKLLAVF